MKLAGWGRFPVLDCRMERLRRGEDLHGLFDRSETMIARGNGRSYGDAALNPDLTLSMLSMDRFQAFDPATGLLTCEAGVLLADILATFRAPGLVSAGGSGNEVRHRRRHDRGGRARQEPPSRRNLRSARGVAHAGDGRGRGPRVQPREERRSVRATLGGMGLTGVILSASFRLRPIETSYLMEETLATRDLDETMVSLEESGDWPSSVAWIDWSASRSRLGRALISRAAPAVRASLPAELASDPLRPALAVRWSVPADAPSVVLNRLSIELFHRLYYRRGRARTGVRTVHFCPFFFPLDRIGAWNRLYGRRGFVQYQCVLPRAESDAGIRALLECVAAAGQGAFPRGPQAVRPRGGRADVVSHGRVYAVARLSGAPAYAGVARCARRDHPRARRARLSRQGCPLHGAARAPGLSPKRRLRSRPGRGGSGRGPGSPPHSRAGSSL